MADKREYTTKHSKNSNDHRAGRTGKRRLYLKLIAVLAFVLLVLICVIKIMAYYESISGIHLSDEGYTHASRYKDCVAIHGIDVSEFQDEINWKKVKSSEADFVFIRAGYRSMESGELKEDADFEKNIKGANKEGIMTGAYFFSQALNEEEAREEADYLIELVDGHDIDMPLVIDFETISGGRLQKAIRDGEFYAASQFHDIVLAFCREVEAKGYESAVYANYDMLTNNMDSTLLDDEAVIWAAQYGGRCDVKGEYSFWQCAETETLDGIDGYVDHDFWYIEPGRVYPTKAKGRKKQISIGECKVSFDKESYKLSNNRARPKAEVTLDGKRLHEGWNYEISFIRNQVSGTGYAIVRGVKKYKDWVAVPFVIE